MLMAAFKNNRGTWTAKFYYTDWTGKRKQKKKEGFVTKKKPSNLRMTS
ncbi:Arm DNA-binding domain-containing protein [Anaerotignum lactatifermentans]